MKRIKGNSPMKPREPYHQQVRDRLAKVIVLYRSQLRAGTRMGTRQAFVTKRTAIKLADALRECEV